MLDQTAQFIPRRFLRNRHLQTLAGNFLPRENALPAPEERLFQVEEDAQVLCHCHWQADGRAARMTVIIVHGLEGSSESQYVIGTGSKAWRDGMNVVRMNMRNCGGTEELTPTLYHSGMSGDVGAVVKSLIAEDKLEHIALVGYSMGGNLVMKIAGEWGRDGNGPPELKAVVGVSPAMDLSPSADALHLKQNRPYEWKFMRGLRRRYRRKAELFPAKYKPGHADATRSVREFDDVITAPYSGFVDAEDYYQRASSGKVAQYITAPALVMHALDDPFVKLTQGTRAKLVGNPHVTYIETKHGGHCAFLAEANGYDGRWAERKAVEFISSKM